jgi:hypothetical protein
MNNDWISLLEKFSNSILIYKISKKESGDKVFEAYNIFGLDININTYYGFIVMVFHNDESKNKFLMISNIDKTTSWNNDIQYVSTKWDESIFPSRIYVEKNKIMFYDEKNNDPFHIKFEKRVRVLKNIFKMLIEIKFDN